MHGNRKDVCGVQIDDSKTKSTRKALVNQCAVPKIIDFGMAMRMGQHKSHASNVQQGTPFYMAPELSTTFRLSRASDVYAFGVIMWEMMMGTSVFRAIECAPLATPAAVPHMHPPALAMEPCGRLVARPCAQR